MMNIPIHINWNNYGFQYMISVGDIYDSQDVYQYIQYPKNDTSHTSHSSQHGLPENDPLFTHLIDSVQFINRSSSNKREKDNSYYDISDSEEYEIDYIPEKIKSRKIIFRLPWFKIDNYIPTDYIIKFTTWIAGVEVIIGQYLISRSQYLASPYIIYKEERYAELVEMDIIDPWSLIYEDEWKSWRTRICGEQDNINNAGSPLNVTIIPVYDEGNKYNITTGANIGASNIVLSDKSDFLGLNLEFKKNTSEISASLVYNKSYSDILEYLSETYLMEIDDNDVSASYSLIITGKEESIDVLNPKIQNLESWEAWLDTLTPEERQREEAKGYDISWIESADFSKSEFGISDWSDYKDGLFLSCIFELFEGPVSDNDPIFSIMSNDVPLTPDIYKYLIITDLDKTPININNVSMLEYTIHAVNKIDKKVIQVENAKDYKSNIIRPVFFRAHNINDTILHPEVSENICLNLNAYKSKVDMFYLKIEGVVFPEIGRNHSGVLFKIQGNLLPHKIEEGILYVLDNHKELVTTGNFKYIS